MCACPQSFEVEIGAVLSLGSLEVENVHGRCGMVRDHTYALAVAPVSHMALYPSLKPSPAAASAPMSVRSAFHHNSCGNACPGSSTHVRISGFLFIIFPFSSLTLCFELKIVGS